MELFQAGSYSLLSWEGGDPAVSLPSWYVPGGGCLLSGLRDSVSDLLEVTVFKEGGFSLWIEATPSVLQKPLDIAFSQKVP